MTKPTLTAALALAGLMFLGSTAAAQAVVTAPPPLPLRCNTLPAARPPSSCPTCRRPRSWEASEAGRC